MILIYNLSSLMRSNLLYLTSPLNYNISNPSKMEEPTIDSAIQGLPLNERVPVVALKKLLDARLALDEDQEKENANIRQKYQNLIAPLLQRASEIIQGKPLKQEQISSIGQYMKPGESHAANLLKGKAIDGYWNAVLTNSPFYELITAEDENVLKNLVDVQIIQPKEAQQAQNGISLKFIFKANPYFNETTLIRSLRLSGGQYVCVEGDPITWKTNAFVVYEKKKVSNKASGEVKYIQGKKINSFFDVFLDWNVEKPNDLLRVGGIINELGNLIIKDSLSYFLGLIDVEQSDDEFDEVEDDDESEEEPETKKKIKK